MKRIATAILVAVVLVALAVVLAGWGEAPYQYPWDGEPRLVASLMHLPSLK